VDGTSHIQELRRIEKLKFGMLRQGPRVEPRELLGYSFPPGLAAEIEGVALRKINTWPAQQVRIFASESRPEYAQLANHVGVCTGKATDLHVVAGEADTGLEQVLMSTRVLQAMTTTLAGSGG
jgi:hypothetical protein